MNSSISYTHSDFLLELSESEFQNSQVPETLEFQKLSSSKSCQVPETLEFQNSRVPKVVKFQKLSSSRNSRVPKVIEFQKLLSSILQNSSSKLFLSSNELSSIIQNFSSTLLLYSIESSSKNSRVPKVIKFPKSYRVPSFRTRVPNYFWVPTNWVPSFRTSVPIYFCVVSTRVPSSELEFQNSSRTTHTFWVPQQFKFHGTLPSSVIS